MRKNLARLFIVLFIIVYTVSCKEDESIKEVPTISNFSPANGAPGTLVTVTGTGFPSDPKKIEVKFGGISAPVKSATPTTVTAEVPTGAVSGIITVTAENTTLTTSSEFIVSAVIESFSPAMGKAGTTITIKGTGFGAATTDNVVKIGDEALSVISASTTSISATIPTNAATNKITVTVRGILSTSLNEFVVDPDFQGFVPQSGAIGSTILIKGTGLTSIESVKLGSQPMEIIAKTPTQVSVKVPLTAVSGKITATFSNKELTSPEDFAVVLEAISAGGPGWDEAFSLALDAQKNILVTGRFSGPAKFGTVSLTSTGTTNAFIAKYNSSLELLWVKQLATADGYGIATDNGGNAYVTGSFFGSVIMGSTTINAPGLGVYLAKIDPEGEILWAKGYGGILSGSVAVDNAGFAYIGGGFHGTMTVGATTLTTSDNSEGGFVIKFNSSSGEMVWAKHFGDVATDIAVGSAGEVFVSGAFFGNENFGTSVFTNAGELDGFVLKLNSSGEIIWATQVGGPKWDNVNSIVAGSNGECYLTGYCNDAVSIGSITTAASGQAILVAKLNSTGGADWVKNLGGGTDCQGQGIALSGGQVYLTGYFGATVSFGSAILTSVNNGRDVFVVKMSTGGNLLSVQAGGGPETDIANELEVDAGGVIYATGSFRASGTVLGTTPLQTAGNDDLFVWKIIPQN